jgi:hypothetical protein
VRVLPVPDHRRERRRRARPLPGGAGRRVPRPRREWRRPHLPERRAVRRPGPLRRGAGPVGQRADRVPSPGGLGVRARPGRPGGAGRRPPDGPGVGRVVARRRRRATGGERPAESRSGGTDRGRRPGDGRRAGAALRRRRRPRGRQPARRVRRRVGRPRDRPRPGRGARRRAPGRHRCRGLGECRDPRLRDRQAGPPAGARPRCRPAAAARSGAGRAGCRHLLDRARRPGPGDRGRRAAAHLARGSDPGRGPPAVAVRPRARGAALAIASAMGFAIVLQGGLR